MVRITIDAALREKLFAGGEPVELVDESGSLLGKVVPYLKPIPPGWAPINPVPSDEELARRSAYRGSGITTDELLAHLSSKP
jgi:hypothetical protein